MTYAKSGTSAEQILYIMHPEGLVAKESSAWVYKYFKTDHLGSTRALLAARGTSLTKEQSTDFYPFGLAHSTNNLHLNRYLFSGKEIQDASIGGSALGLYDYGWRYDNPVLGRWSVQDPWKQFINPYMFCANNPVNFIDYMGLWTLTKDGWYTDDPNDIGPFWDFVTSPTKQGENYGMDDIQSFIKNFDAWQNDGGGGTYDPLTFRSGFYAPKGNPNSFMYIHYDSDNTPYVITISNPLVVYWRNGQWTPDWKSFMNWYHQEYPTEWHVMRDANPLLDRIYQGQNDFWYTAVDYSLYSNSILGDAMFLGGSAIAFADPAIGMPIAFIGSTLTYASNVTRSSLNIHYGMDSYINKSDIGFSSAFYGLGLLGFLPGIGQASIIWPLVIFPFDKAVGYGINNSETKK